MAVVNLFVVIFFCVFGVRSSIYETHQNIERQGYVAQTHNVVTPDGYILEMHRIPFRLNETWGLVDRPVVFVMHGLTAASNSYIALGRENAIAFNLADAGFDVWMGNARGTRNSRQHVTLNPDVDKIKFFDFTWHEIGFYDISTMIDYILEYTGNERLHYIGHSQGGTAFLVLTTTRPEYNEKIASAHLLAGVGYMEYFPHTLLRTVATFTDALWRLAVNLRFVELFPPSDMFPRSEGDTSGEPEFWENCAGNLTLKDFCSLIRVQDFMYTSNNSAIDILPGGASVKQFAHYGQNIKSKIFRQWDYGTVENIQIYGSPEPPIYNLSLITVNVTMHYTISDNLLDERDVFAMAKDMPNTMVRKVARETFEHGDFVLSHDVKELVTEHVVDAIKNFRDDDNDSEVTEPGPALTDSSSTAVLSCIVNMYLIIYIVFIVL